MIYIFIRTLLLVWSPMVGGETNVGTVLFTRSDAMNETWPTSKLALLKARLYTQHLIPPLTTPQTPEFVEALLNYFQDCYTTISQESKDRQTDLILTTAFTDVVGGYLKMFALPLTKYAYYGGTLPKQDAIKLFLFYEDVKNYLGKTDDGWAEPALPILKSMTINIAVPPFTRSSSLIDPCQHLSYFQRTPQGLDIPTPIIDWNTFTMFIPLSDQTLVNLYSSNVSNALHKYYDVAVNCVRSMKPGSLDSFNERFQSFLKREVVPHLSDNLLYTALEGVLGLVNDTNDLSVQTVYVSYAVDDSDHMISTKMVIVLIIIALELVWCLPIIACMLYRRMKRRRSTMAIFEPRCGTGSCREFYHCGQGSSEELGELRHLGPTVCSCGRNCARCPPCRLEVTAMLNDSSKRISGTQTKTIHSMSTSTRMSDELRMQRAPSDGTTKTAMLSVQCPSKTETVRLPRSTLKKTGDASVDSCIKCSPVYISKVDTKRPSKCQPMKTIVATARAAHLERECSNKDVPETQNQPAEADATATIKPVKRARRSSKSLKAIGDEKRLQSGDEAFLEIRIDQPRREISFDVSRHGEVRKVIDRPRKSKIPRSIGTSPRAAAGTSSVQPRRQGLVPPPRPGLVPPPRPGLVPPPRPAPIPVPRLKAIPPPRENRGKTLIPMPKWATDDIALLRDVGTKTPKLNVTL